MSGRNLVKVQAGKKIFTPGGHSTVTGLCQGSNLALYSRCSYLSVTFEIQLCQPHCSTIRTGCRGVPAQFPFQQHFLIKWWMPPWNRSIVTAAPTNLKAVQSPLKSKSGRGAARQKYPPGSTRKCDWDFRLHVFAYIYRLLQIESLSNPFLYTTYLNGLIACNKSV